MDGSTRDPRQRRPHDSGVPFLTSGSSARALDATGRTHFVADLVEVLRADKGPLEVLDIGGQVGLLQSLLPEDRVVTRGIEQARSGGFGSQDASFDLVVASDVLQKLAFEQREAFLLECRRLARHWAVMVGPFRSQRVEQAEGCLRTFLMDKLGEDSPELAEHARHGLPSRGFVESRMRELGGRVESIGHGKLEPWLATMCITSYMGQDADEQPAVRELRRFFEGISYSRDAGGPTYRHAVIAAFEGARLPDPNAFHGASDTKRFELEHEISQAREARGELESKLDELRRAGSELETQVESAKGASSEEKQRLERALTAACQRIEQHDEELERQRSREQRQRAAYSENVSSMELDIDSYRQLVASTSQQVAAQEDALREAREALEAAELEAQKLRHSGTEAKRMQADMRQAVALAESLQRELAGRDHEILRQQAQLEAVQVEADQLTRRLEGEQDMSDDLRRQLGGRLANLRRAFGRKSGDDEFDD